MGKWGEASKERAAARREYQIEEASEALVMALKKNKYNKEGRTIPKSALIPLVAECCENNRMRIGYRFIPTVENVIVQLPDERFIKGSWKDINIHCAETLKKYIVWEGGRGGGMRLGSFKEYQMQQSTLAGMTFGIMETHNLRSEIINEQGGTSVRIGLMLEAGKKND